VTIAVGVMARAPSTPGKTRLAADLSEPGLRALREALLSDTLTVICSVAHIQPFVFVTPDDAGDEMLPYLPREVPVRPQRGDDLGARMRNALAALIDVERFDAAVLVGSDIPLIAPEHIDEATALLRTRGGVVLGPADDGGYYLIGMTRVFPELFAGIEWGSDSVLMDTMRIAERQHIDVCLIRGAYDIDTLEDLRRLERDLERELPHVAPSTRRVLKRLGA
jgi:uncharacterized protein